MMKTRLCPTLSELENAAHQAEPPRPVAEHLRTCKVCREKMAQIRDDETVLEKVRDAAAHAMAPEQRQRIMRICRAAAAESRRPN